MLERGGYLPARAKTGMPRRFRRRSISGIGDLAWEEGVRPSTQVCIIVSAATPKSMALRCFVYASRISVNSSTPTERRQLGHSATDVFEPYYCEAEALFHVHGARGEDPTEPRSSKPYAYPPVLHEPRIQALDDRLVTEGLHPFHLPLGIKLDQNPDGERDDLQPVHTVRCVRRLPLRDQCKSRRTGYLR